MGGLQSAGVGEFPDGARQGGEGMRPASRRQVSHPQDPHGETHLGDVRRARQGPKGGEKESRAVRLRRRRIAGFRRNERMVGTDECGRLKELAGMSMTIRQSDSDVFFIFVGGLLGVDLDRSRRELEL